MRTKQEGKKREQRASASNFDTQFMKAVVLPGKSLNTPAKPGTSHLCTQHNSSQLAGAAAQEARETCVRALCIQR